MASKIISAAARAVGVKKFLESELSAADLARNPSAGLEAAKAIQSELNRRTSKGISISGLDEIEGSLFQGTTILSEFHSEQQRLQREFVDAAVEKRFGKQGVTSVSSTVNAQGVRTPIGGQRVGTAPTSAQRNAIAAEFKTPLVSVAGGGFTPAQSPVPFTRAIGSIAGQVRTIVGGGGFHRFRTPTASTAPTILTSDADVSQNVRRPTLGSPTILG